MAVDKNLFLYDLAVVAIMKNEAPYVKEWLDYHLLAGVNHFYIYDNDSPDNLKEVLQPYIDAGIVTYTFYPGKARQYEAYNEAVKNFRFFNRYMTFIDADEFVFPQNNKTITEVADEILKNNLHSAALVANILNFGSNFQEKADYTRGVLERFTRRAPTDFAPPLPYLNGLPGGNAHVSTIANPRYIKYFDDPHHAKYFFGKYAINSNGKIVYGSLSFPINIEKIAMYHYHTKSKEEYEKKVRRGNADYVDNRYDIKNFENRDRNEVFDDSILKYREARLKMGGGTLGRQINYQQLYIALLQNLSQTFVQNVPLQFYQGKMETFLTCRKLTEYLREKILDKNASNFFEEAALNAIYKILMTNASITDVNILFSELPAILRLNYPVVDEIRKVCINIVPQLMNLYRMNNLWRDFNEMYYFGEMLKTFDNYNHK